MMSHPILFFGTSAFAVPILKRLAADPRFQIKAVVTQPDKPVGRHAELTAPPVKLAAIELGLPVLQFGSVKTDEAFAELTKFEAEAAVVASFGQIIPKELLDAFPKGMVNAHASVLPMYRGASPIAAAVANGDAETGVTVMLMDERMDHGPALAVARERIAPDDTTPALEARLANLAAKTLPDVMTDYLEGRLEAVEQDHAAATYVKLLTRDDGKLDPTAMTGEQMERLVRAYTPWPGTFLDENGKRLKVLEARMGKNDGYPVLIGSDGNALSLIKVQPEGKPAMDGAAFLRGAKSWNK